jgi:hypothetical protein
MIIGKLTTDVLQDHQGAFDKAGAIGEFNLDVKIPSHVFNAASDKKAITRSTIAQHLASACADTEVPAEIWVFQPTPQFQKMFGWPEAMRMGK